jgi:hypothetical protein
MSSIILGMDENKKPKNIRPRKQKDKKVIMFPNKLTLFGMIISFFIVNNFVAIYGI